MTLPAETLEKLNRTALYFTVTTGRSGTAFLTRYLGHYKGVYATHEPEPRFHEVMRPALSDTSLAKRFLLEKKLPTILAVGAEKYVETSHLSCKGLLEAFFELGVFPNLILLRRGRREVAKSMCAMNTIPGRTEVGLLYYLKPDDNGVLLPIQNWKNLTDYQLCYWYTLETEERQKRYAEAVSARGAKVLDVDFNKLLSGKLADDLARFLGTARLSFAVKLRLFLLSFFKFNTKNAEKTKRESLRYIDFNLEESEVLNLLRA